MRAAFVARSVSATSVRAVNYDPIIDRLRAVRRTREARPLGEWVSALGTVYAAVLTRVDCDAPYGDELLSQVDAFASEPTGRRIRGDVMPFVNDLRIVRGDILLAGAGQIGPTTMFGRATIADGRLAGKLAAGDLMVLRGGDPDDDAYLFLYGFLCSSVGVAAVRSCAYGTSIPRMRPDLLARLPVPVADSATTKRVATLIREALSNRDRYAAYLSAARRVLNEQPAMADAYAASVARGPRSTIWSGALPTIRAWNYASAGDALALLRRAWRGVVGDALAVHNGIEKGGRFARIDAVSPHGVDLLSQRDVFMMRPLSRRIARPDIHDQLAVESADLFLASRGQLTDGTLFGAAELGRNLPRGAMVSEDFVRLRTRDGMANLLVAFLGTEIGRSLVRSTAYGTSIPGMRLDLFQRLPMPDLDAQALNRVDAAIEESVRGRAAAARAEDEAIRIIEEEVLPQWLA